jgi:hypothetical protein
MISILLTRTKKKQSEKPTAATTAATATMTQTPPQTLATTPGLGIKCSTPRTRDTRRSNLSKS